MSQPASGHHRAPGRVGTGKAGLLEKLLAALRPEFRADVLVHDPGDPVLGAQQCAVPGCDRPVRGNELCNSHNGRWRRRGCPDLAVFTADAGPAIEGRRELAACTVPGCRYGAAGHGLCRRHRSRWVRAGRPDAAAWAAGAPALQVGDRPECALSFCTVWTESDHHVFCMGHYAQWQRAGRPDVAEFTAARERYGKAVTDFRGLPRQVKFELQYALQCRRDEQSASAPPAVVRRAVRTAAASGVTSLLDLPEQQWRQRCALPGTPREGRGVQRDWFLLYARDKVETLRDGQGWEAEYPREVWRLHKIPGIERGAGQPHARCHLRFDRITQPWLADLAKRWLRLRLTSGLSVGAAAGNMAALTGFSAFLATAAPDLAGLAGLDRPLLERYLAWLAAQPGQVGTRRGRVEAVHLFLRAIRQHGWDDTLPTGAAFFPGDFPRRGQPVTRHLAEHVMAQVEAPANLDRWRYPEGRLVTVILIRCGLRVSSACSLAFDCLLHDGQGAPYLRYCNTKMAREAAVPIDEELEAEIRAQQQRVAARWPGGNPHLFPRMTANAGGRLAMSPDSYRGMLNDWLAICDIHDENGQTVHLTPHQWRHTFATRLVNRDVPLEVIRTLLDHESTQMTAHYAKITDRTVRRRWEEATKVNVKGERVTLDPDGLLGQAQWAKTRYGIATQTLPNGYCGLPIQRSCPHANSCLTCPVFLTGPEFLPELREQRHRTLTLVDTAETKGQARVAEMNRQVLTNLDRMIGEIEKDEQAGAADAG